MFINMDFLCNTTIKQEKQYMYSVTQRHVRPTTVAVDKQ